MDDEDYSLYADDAALTSQTLNSDGTPKRPMNAFMIFARRRRPQVSAENQSMRTGDISKILSQEWKAMLPNDKQFYQSQAKQLKDSFNAKYPDYVYRRRPNNTRKRRKPDVSASGRGDTDEAESSPDVEEPPQLPDNGHPRYPQAPSEYAYSHARTASYPYPPYDSARSSGHGGFYSSGSAYDAHAGLRKAQSIPAMSMPISLSPSQNWAPLPASGNSGFYPSQHSHSSYGGSGNGYPSAPSPREGPARGSSRSPRYSPYATPSSLPTSASYSHSAYNSSSSASSSASSASPSFSSSSPSYTASGGGGGPGSSGGGVFGINAGYGSGYAAPRALVGAGGIGLLDLVDTPSGDGHGGSGGRGEDYNNSYWRPDKLL